MPSFRDWAAHSRYKKYYPEHSVLLNNSCLIIVDICFLVEFFSDLLWLVFKVQRQTRYSRVANKRSTVLINSWAIFHTLMWMMCIFWYLPNIICKKFHYRKNCLKIAWICTSNLFWKKNINLSKIDRVGRFTLALVSKLFYFKSRKFGS